MKTRMSEAERIAEYERIADAPRVFCWRRPLEVVGRSPEDKPVVIERRDYQDVLIDRVSGKRSVLQLLEDPRKIDRWHDSAAKSTTRQLVTPVTATEAQLRPLLDTRSKTIFLFGANQSGKSTIGGSWLGSRIAARRGMYLWLAPTQEKTSVGVEKLTVDTEFARAVIPSELIAYVPESHKSARQEILLVDGTSIQLRYCSRKGQNLKGLTGVLAGVMDEAGDVTWEINFTIAVARLLRAGGQLLVPTTPVVPSWLQEKDQQTRTYAEVDTLEQMGERVPANTKVYFSMHDNPYLTLEEIDRTIETWGGPDTPKAQREGFGRWVADGGRLWRHFINGLPHVVEWGRRDVSLYGFTDITKSVAKEVFRGFSQKNDCEWIGGFDYNFDPFSAVLAKIIVPEGKDQRDPENWCIYVDDVAVKAARSTSEFAEWLGNEAGGWNGRGLPANAFAGLHGIGDGEGFYHVRDRRAHASTDAEAMRKAGFVIRAPRYNEGNPLNPPRKVRIGFLNELFFRNQVLINRTRGEDLIVSLDSEVDDGSGDTRKGKKDKSDKRSGVTDALCYLAYAVRYHRRRAPGDGGKLGRATGQEIKKAVGW